MGVNRPENPLRLLQRLGQSAWLDDIRRAWLQDGTLARLIADDGVSGVTSNPAIFEKSISGSHDYDAAIATAFREGLETGQVVESLMVEDVARAADLFRPVHTQSGGRDGFVSLEVSPHLAHDTERTVAEARRLWQRLQRPNVMIKVPATRAGLPAIRRLIAGGINVNVTLLFSVSRYREVLAAWITGLEDRARSGQPLAPVASVASFFLSRIDTLVDRRLDALASTGATALRGRAAIACAQLAYQECRRILTDARWQALADHGAQPQRLLWASTSTKDPAYPDVKYVEALVAPGTVNTLTIDTLDAYRDHGDPRARIEEGLERSRALPDALAAQEIDLEAVADQLEAEGVKKFVEPFDRLHQVLQRRRHGGASA